MTNAETYVAQVLAMRVLTLNDLIKAASVVGIPHLPLSQVTKYTVFSVASSLWQELTVWLHDSDARWLRSTERELPVRTPYREAWS